MRSWPRRWCALLALVAATPGCTLIGAGVGGRLPSYSSVELGTPAATLQRGDRIELTLQDGGTVDGRVRDVDGSRVTVRTDSGTVAVDLRDATRLRVARESHWLAGAIAGLVVDVAVVAIAGSRAADVAPSTGSNVHVGGDGVVVGGR